MVRKSYTTLGNDEEKTSPSRYSKKELTRLLYHNRNKEDREERDLVNAFSHIPPVISIQACSSTDEVESDISIDHHTFFSKRSDSTNKNGASATQTSSWHCFGPSSFVQKAVNRNMDILPLTTPCGGGVGVGMSVENNAFVDWPSDEETPVPPPSSISKQRTTKGNLQFSTTAAKKAMGFFSGDHAFECGNFNSATTAPRTTTNTDSTEDKNKNKMNCKKWPLSHHDFLTMNPCSAVMGRDDNEEAGNRISAGTENQTSLISSSHEARDPFPLSSRHRQNL